MKNLFKSSLLFLMLSLAFISCEEQEERLVEGVVPEISNIQSSIFNLIDLSTAQVTFDVNTIGVPVNSVDAYISYQGSDPVQFTTMSSFPSTLTLTANDAAAAVGISPASIAIGDVFRISFVCNTQDGRALRTNTFFDAVGSCPSNLDGEYTVTTTYGYHDFLPNYDTNTMNLTITKLANGNYTSSDFSGGLYGSGPYVAPYGTSALDAVEFSEVCGNILWSGQSDPWGDLVMTPGGVNSVDPVTGVITISWTALQYGENGVSVYTPL